MSLLHEMAGDVVETADREYEQNARRYRTGIDCAVRHVRRNEEELARVQHVLDTSHTYADLAFEHMADLGGLMMMQGKNSTDRNLGKSHTHGARRRTVAGEDELPTYRTVRPQLRIVPCLPVEILQVDQARS